MAHLAFEISYSSPSLPAWEATNALRAIIQIYYYILALLTLFSKNSNN
jgi:hypothetical protein